MELICSFNRANETYSSDGEKILNLQLSLIAIQSYDFHTSLKLDCE